MTDEKRKVAETLDEFRGQWKYNLLDAHVRAMNAQVPTFFQWDDHEVVNNWSPGKDLRDDDRYTREVGAAARRPRRPRLPRDDADPLHPGRAGPGLPQDRLRAAARRLLRRPALLSRRELPTAEPGPLTDASRILGAGQVAWLKRALAARRATWKVIASDMPIGLVVLGRHRRRAALPRRSPTATAARPRGRELEFADLLRYIKAAGIANTVWLTADVHYTAAHHYDPSRARFQDFDPFWEFVAGPLHAGSFGPNALDPTFGPEVRFVKAPPPGQGNRAAVAPACSSSASSTSTAPPAQMTVRLMDRDDTELWTRHPRPRPGGLPPVAVRLARIGGTALTREHCANTGGSDMSTGSDEGDRRKARRALPRRTPRPGPRRALRPGRRSVEAIADARHRQPREPRRRGDQGQARLVGQRDGGAFGRRSTDPTCTATTASR